jgi:hypothetical protein
VCQWCQLRRIVSDGHVVSHPSHSRWRQASARLASESGHVVITEPLFNLLESCSHHLRSSTTRQVAPQHQYQHDWQELPHILLHGNSINCAAHFSISPLHHQMWVLAITLITIPPARAVTAYVISPLRCRFLNVNLKTPCIGGRWFLAE